mmetsp:Transcript_17788/g.44385  ORF Transcript_17788/g.44385 Transcript_17788/m.44385 type:complete len:1361 (-) Transcript_17788:564-4646(-)
MEPSSPPSPRSPPSNNRDKAANSSNYWSIFSQEQTDSFASPQRGSATCTPRRPPWRKIRGHDESSSIQSNDDSSVNELTSLILPSPLRITRDEGIRTQKPTNRGFPTASGLTPGFKFSSPHRSLVRGRPQTPLSSSSKSSKASHPLLLQSMRYWNVDLPPLKKHVVDGKLVDTFRGSLYGNDRNRNLPVAKRRLTIELFGHDLDTKLWGNRKRRNFSDIENNNGNNCSSGGSSCGGVSRLSEPSWELFKGASSDDFSIAKGDWQSDTDSSANDSNSTDSRVYQLAERDIVVLRVMKSRVVTQYDDEFGLGDNSINSGLKDRKWESQSMSDRTMSWMVGLDAGDGDDNASFSSGESLTKKHMRWTESSRTRLSHIELVREDFEANEVDLKMGVGARTVVQTFRFDEVDAYGTRSNKHEGNARTFSRLFRVLKRLEKERAQRLAAAHRSLLSERDSFKDGEIYESSRGNAHSQGSESNGNYHDSRNNNGNDCNSEGEKEVTEETVSILVEIVSAINLPPSGERSRENHDGINPHYTGVAKGKDFSFADPEVPPSSDPYVVIRDGKIDIHSTSFVPNTVNPVWALSTGSLCLLQSDLVNFFDRSNVLEFTVKNHGAIADIEHQAIGTVMVHKTELLNGTGERKCYQILRPPMASRLKGTMLETVDTGVEAPYLYLRYRQASVEDIEFMQTFRKETNQNFDQCIEEGVYANESFLAPTFHSTTMLDQSTEKQAIENGKSRLYRVKPTPNPDDQSGTEWATKTQIEEFSKDHSTAWTMAGSGSIGKLYIEIIGCDGLTKSNRAVGKKSNTFINVVFEDSIVNTEVIHDCFSPRWMPWSQRAFVMNMMHLSSQVFVGVFDYNNDHGKTDFNHDPLGRVVINLSKLRPRAIHTLTYNLYDSDDINRKVRGTITIRLRLAIDDERRALISELSLRDYCYVSTVKESDFRCASYSITKNNQPHSLNLQSLTAHANELLDYIEVADQIADALIAVLLWKGHFPVALNLDSSPFFIGTARRREIVVNLPLHSMVAFGWATILALDLEKCVSFLFFLVGWIFLAVLETQRRHPSPWRRPRSYIELLNILLFHKSKFAVFGRPPLRRTIHPNERLGEMEIFESDEAEQAAARQKRVQISSSERKQHQKSLNQAEYTTPRDVSNDGKNSSTSCRTEDSTIARARDELASFDANEDPSKAVIFYFQKFFCEACRVLRVCSSVFLWKESYLAFWITSLCFCASFLAFWIPWSWLMQWGLRLFVWPFFGPWMKFVDIFYFQERKNLCTDGEKILPRSDIEILVDLLDRMMERKEATAICRENSLKSKDMKRYMFGKVRVVLDFMFNFELTKGLSSFDTELFLFFVCYLTHCFNVCYW